MPVFEAAKGNRYSRENEAEARQAKVLTADEARRIAVNIARLIIGGNRRPLYPERWGNRPARLWIAGDLGCCASD
jgi:hypothetical protein